MTSWEIPALNGGLNGKIIEVKLGPLKSHGLSSLSGKMPQPGETQQFISILVWYATMVV